MASRVEQTEDRVTEKHEYKNDDELSGSNVIEKKIFEDSKQQISETNERESFERYDRNTFTNFKKDMALLQFGSFQRSE